MSDGAHYLSQLEAHKSTITSKQAELRSYIAEKNNLQEEIAKIEASTLPSLRAAKQAQEQELAAAVENWKTQKAAAYGLWQNAIKALQAAQVTWENNIDAKEDIYNTASEAQALWYNRWKHGCAWSGSAKGWTGSYCGRYKFGCSRSSHNYNTNAPSTCLKSSIRKSRQQHALSKTNSTGTAKSTALNQWNASKNEPNNVKTAKANVASAKLNYDKVSAQQQPMSGLSQAIASKNQQIQAYVASGGVIDEKEARIAFVDGKISSLTGEIKQVEQEKYLAEQAYQDWKKKADQEAAIIAQNAAQAEADRIAKQKALDASIEANLANTDPTMAALKAKTSGDNKMYMLAGAALLIAGIYVIKKK